MAQTDMTGKHGLACGRGRRFSGRLATDSRTKQKGGRRRKGVDCEWQLVRPSRICAIWDRRRCWHSSGSDVESRETDAGGTSGAGSAWGGA